MSDENNTPDENQSGTPATSEQKLAPVIDFQAARSVLVANPSSGLRCNHERWQGQTIPYGYQLNKKGLGRLGGPDNDKVTHVSAPIMVLATTVNFDGSNAGLIIEFETKRGEFVQMTVPLTRLYEDPKLIAQDLADQNFFLHPGQCKDLLVYLSQCVPGDEKISVSQTGWAPSQTDKLVFVGPGKSTDDDYFFQPERFNRVNTVAQSGSLQDWVDSVFSTDPFPLFSVCCSIAAPLIRFTGLPTTGVHIYGDTTSGKTTLLQLAASVWGDGADPGDAYAKPYAMRWNMTPNAMEAVAAGHNDLPTILDELGSADDRHIQRLVYDLAGGQGKAAMDSSRQLKKQRSWRTFVMSSGEVSLLDKMQTNFNGRKSHAKAGAMLRILDLSIDEGAIRSAAAADKIKAGARKNYGSLGPAFIDGLISKFSDLTLQKTVNSQIEKSVKRLSETRRFDKIQQRALKTFAIIETAGLLLVYLKLIPGLTVKHVEEALDNVVTGWAKESGEMADGQRALHSIREYLIQHKSSRFIKYTTNTDGNLTSANEKDKQNVAGYVGMIKGEECYFFSLTAFDEATAGEKKSAAKLLKLKELLVSDKEDRLTHRLSVDGQRITCYCIKADILSI